jgi:outer membrane protein assembly factor BamB
MTKCIAFCIILLLTSATFAADTPLVWPQFRGPDGSGVADPQKPPLEVGPEKNVKWKVVVPPGFSSPIVVGDKLVLTAFDSNKLYTIAYSRATGKELWRADAGAKEIEPFHKTEGSPAASTPATDGQRIVSYFGSCGLCCYDLSGKELWKFELPVAHTPGDFGSGVSPIIADGSVILVRDEMIDPKILAVDLAKGELKWEKKRQSRSGYGTPTVWHLPEGNQIVASGYGQLIAYDLKTGDEKWFVAGMPSACCTSPVVAEGNLFFAGWSPGDPETADPTFKMPTFDETLQGFDKNKDGVISKDEVEGTPMQDFFNSMDSNKDGKHTRDEADDLQKFLSASKNSAFAVKPGGSGDVTKSHVVWKKNKGLPYVASAIAYRGQYVMVKDGGLVTAYDAKDGNEIYVQKRATEGKYYASPVAANGYIYLTGLDDGAITVLKAGEKTPEVAMKNPPLGERVAATPAIADNTMYVRTAGHMYAFADKK